MIPFAISTQIDFPGINSRPQSGYVSFWDRALENKYAYQSSSVSAEVNMVLDFLGQRNVVVEDRLVVEECLARHAGIIAHLYDSQDKIFQYFGTSNLKLGIFSDPDSGNDHQELYLEIETTLSPREANERLSQVNREWRIASGENDLMSLNLTLRFV